MPESSDLLKDNDITVVENSAEAQNVPYPPDGVLVGKSSDMGQVRAVNEDSFFVFDSLIHSHRGLETFGLFIVTDGMGGHENGEVASSLAAKIAAGCLLKDVYVPYLRAEQNAVPINEALTNSIQRANEAVITTVPDAGTTIVIALIMGSNAYIAHVGDSRAYIFKDNIIKAITEDHSLSQKLQEMGQSAEEALQAQNVLYKAIGQGETIEADIRIQHLPPKALLLLCSDGLWGMVDDNTIEAVLKTASNPQTACDKLIALANENGGRDNITVIIVSTGGGT